MWRYANGRVYSNKAANDFKRFVKVFCRQKRVIPFGKQKRLNFTMRVFRPRSAGDLDNRIKLILDALNKIAFDDDRQIVEIHAFRFEDPLNPRVEVEITEAAMELNGYERKENR